MSRSCNCGAPIGKDSTSGLCRPCFARRPRSAETKARISAARLRLVSDPEHVERQTLATRAGISNAMKRPDELERRRQHGRELGLAFGAINLATPAGSVERLANGRKSRATKMAWCPFEYRESYRALRRKDFSAADAKRMTLELIDIDRRRYFATGQLQQARR